jgi:hypothetical protein
MNCEVFEVCAVGLGAAKGQLRGIMFRPHDVNAYVHAHIILYHACILGLALAYAYV